jgi:hypothetical protein
MLLKGAVLQQQSLQCLSIFAATSASIKQSKHAVCVCIKPMPLEVSERC